MTKTTVQDPVASSTAPLIGTATSPGIWPVRHSDVGAKEIRWGEETWGSCEDKQVALGRVPNEFAMAKVTPAYAGITSE